MIIDILRPKKVDAKTIKIHVKVRDGFCASIIDNDGECLMEYEGYVPDFMPQKSVSYESGSHYGDYLILDIDLDSGKILNWQTPTPKQIQDFIELDLSE
jgi:hypothetical protein